MNRLLTVTATMLALCCTPAVAHKGDRDADLPEPGVFIEGIGVDERAGVFYVSATNRDGTIYRGRVGARDQVLEVWQPPTAGDNGRGIDVNREGRVYVAGGPTAEVRVFDRRGRRLAELPTGAAGSFLNDVWVGPDGAAYVTDSSLPLIWRVSERHGQWRIERWLDVSGTIAYTPALTDFDLGGIVTTHDTLLRPRARRAAVADRPAHAPDHRGRPWRRAADERRRDRAARATLWVVQNFSARSAGSAPARLHARDGRGRAADARRPHVHDGQARARQAARGRLEVRLPAGRRGRRGSDRHSGVTSGPRTIGEVGMQSDRGLTRRQALAASAAAAGAAALGAPARRGAPRTTTTTVTGTPAAEAPPLTLTGARLLDPARGEVTDGATIVFERGVVQRAGGGNGRQAGGVIDVGGAFVLPGLIDAHTHAATVAAAKQAVARARRRSAPARRASSRTSACARSANTAGSGSRARWPRACS